MADDYNGLDKALGFLDQSLITLRQTLRDIREGMEALEPEPELNTKIQVQPVVEISHEAAFACYQACQTVLNGYEGVPPSQLRYSDQMAIRVCGDAIALVKPPEEPRIYVKPEALKIQHYVEQVEILLKTHYRKELSEFPLNREKIRNSYLFQGGDPITGYKYYADNYFQHPTKPDGLPPSQRRRGPGRPRKYG